MKSDLIQETQHLLDIIAKRDLNDDGKRQYIFYEIILISFIFFFREATIDR